MAKSLDIDAPGAVTKPFDVVDSLQRPADLGGFTQLMLEHQAMVFSLAYHFLQNRASAEDLTQDVFLGLYRSLHTIRSPAHVKHWLRSPSSTSSGRSMSTGSAGCRGSSASPRWSSGTNRDDSAPHEQSVVG